MKCHPVCPFSIARVRVDDETLGSALNSGGESVGASNGRRQGDEDDVKEEAEHPDLLASRPCGLVFAHAWCL
jgi:hypothetical protein